jgi:ElaB/YqjD/DUF883 family membrane-anchored ribosome-binding protein
MKKSMDEFDRAKGRMAGDFNAVITDSEDLLNAAAAASGDGFATARAKFEEKLRSARASLADASRTAVEKAREGAAATDDYVHDSPWTAIGVAAAAGILIGFLISRR